MPTKKGGHLFIAVVGATLSAGVGPSPVLAQTGFSQVSSTKNETNTSPTMNEELDSQTRDTIAIGTATSQALLNDCPFYRNTERGNRLLMLMDAIDGSDRDFNISSRLIDMLNDQESFDEAVDILTVFRPNPRLEKRLLFLAAHSVQKTHPSSIDLIRHAFESNDVFRQSAAIELLKYAGHFNGAAALLRYEFKSPALRRQLLKIAG